VEALADMTPEQLEAIEGIGPKTVEKISLAVNNYFASLEGVAVEGDAVAEGEVPVLQSAEGTVEADLAAGEEISASEETASEEASPAQELAAEADTLSADGNETQGEQSATEEKSSETREQ
jgi:N utilization substance protein A